MDLSVDQARTLGLKLLAEKGFATQSDYVDDLNKAIDATYASGIVLSDNPAGKISIASTPFVKFWPNSYNMIGSGLEKERFYFRAASSTGAVSDSAAFSAANTAGTPGTGKVAIPPPQPSQIAAVINSITAGMSAQAKAYMEARARAQWSNGQNVYFPQNLSAGISTTTLLIILAGVAVVAAGTYFIWKDR